ncbi:hypothetical protein ACFQV4_29275 [Streptomyces thermocarboxydus]
MTTVQEASEPSDDSDDEPDSDEENEQPRWADTGWLNTVFGPGWDAVPGDRLRETSEALFALVSTEAGEDQEPQSLFRALNRVTRQVLHLPGDARPGPADHQLLGSLALDASSDDLETTDDLARYFVERQIETGRGALDEGTAARPRGERRRTRLRPVRAARPRTGLLRPARHRPGRRTARAMAEPLRGRRPAGRRRRRGLPHAGPHLPRDPPRRARDAHLLRRSGPRRGHRAGTAPHIAAPLAVLVAGTTGRRVWRPEAPVAVATHPRPGPPRPRPARRRHRRELGTGRPLGAGRPARRPRPEQRQRERLRHRQRRRRTLQQRRRRGVRPPRRPTRPRTADRRAPHPAADHPRLRCHRQARHRRPVHPAPPRHVAEVDAGDGTGAEADALLLPSQDHGTVLMADRCKRSTSPRTAPWRCSPTARARRAADARCTPPARRSMPRRPGWPRRERAYG